MSLYRSFLAAIEDLDLQLASSYAKEVDLGNCEEEAGIDSELPSTLKDNSTGDLAVRALQLCRQVLSLAQGSDSAKSFMKTSTLSQTLGQQSSTDLATMMSYRSTSVRERRPRDSSPFLSKAAQRAGLSKNLGSNGLDEISDLRFRINKLLAQRKVARSRNDLAISILKGKLKSSTQKNEKYVSVMQEQEVALKEQAEIISSLRHRLKRTWSQDPHIAMSPRTKRILNKFNSDRSILKVQKHLSLHANESKDSAGGKTRAFDLHLTPDQKIPASPSLTCSAVQNLNNGRLMDELFCLAQQCNNGDLLSILICDNTRQLAWVGSYEQPNVKVVKIKSAVLPSRGHERIVSPESANVLETILAKAASSSEASPQAIKGNIEWFPIQQLQSGSSLGFLRVDIGDAGTDAGSREYVSRQQNIWSVFASTIHPAVETSMLMNRVDAVCTQTATRISKMAKKGNLGPIWSMIEASAKRLFDHTLEATVRLYDREREELIRYKSRLPQTDRRIRKGESFFDEIRHSVHTGKTTYNRDRSGRYRGYGMQMIMSDSKGEQMCHPHIINRFEEDNDDCFVSFGKAKAVLAVTMAGGNGEPTGILEVSRREGGAYTVAEEAACIHFVNRVNYMISSARVICEQFRHVSQLKTLQNALRPVSLRSLSGEAELLKILSVNSKQILNAERSLWFLVDEDNGCYRSKLSEHGTEIVARFNRGSILDVVRDTKSCRCIGNVKSCSDRDAEILKSSDYMESTGDVDTTVAVPLLGEDGSVIGVAQVINRVGSAEPFGHTAVEILTTMAGFASVAFQNYRLLDDVISQRGFALDHLEDLHSSAEVIETVIFNAGKAVNADYTVLFLNPSIDEDRGKYLLLYDSEKTHIQHKIDNVDDQVVESDKSDHWAMVSMNSLAGHCAQTGEIVNIYDARADARRDKNFDRILAVHRGREFQRVAVLCVPIVDPKGNVTGVVQVMNKRVKGGGNYGYFVPADETKLRGLLAAAAVSIKSAMLHDAAEKSYNRLNQLLEVAKAVSKEHDIHTLLKRVLDAAQDVVGATKSSIWTIDYVTEELCSSFIVPNQEIRIPLNAGIAGAVASSGKFEHIPDAYRDSRFDQEVDRKTGNRTRNILCAPLISSHGATLGVVQVLNKHGGRSFTDEDINLIQAFASQAACSLENLQMFRHIHKLQQYANTVEPTSNSIALTIDAQGHCIHSSINPMYVLGVSIEEMRSAGFPMWIGQADSSKRNRQLAVAMARILGDGSQMQPTKSVSFHNYTYVSPTFAKILMNITLTPIFTNSFQVKGLNVVMTNIKRHKVKKIVEARYNYKISNMIKIPWDPLHDPSSLGENILPHRTISTDIDDALASAEMQESSRFVMDSGTLVTPNPRRVSMTLQSMKSRSQSDREAYKAITRVPTYGEEAKYSVHREVQDSSCALLAVFFELVSSEVDSFQNDSKTENIGGANSPEKSVVSAILKSSLNRSFGVGVRMRLHPDDFVHHFRLEAMCIIAEAGGFIDRSYPNMVVASFGVRDADVNNGSHMEGATSKEESESIVQCCEVAMKLSLLSEKFKKEMLQYEAKRRKKDEAEVTSSSVAPQQYLRTNIGVHSCAVPVSSLPPKPLWQEVDDSESNKINNINKLEEIDEEDDSAANNLIQQEDESGESGKNPSDIVPKPKDDDSILDNVLMARSLGAELLGSQSAFETVLNDESKQNDLSTNTEGGLNIDESSQDESTAKTATENETSKEESNTAEQSIVSNSGQVETSQQQKASKMKIPSMESDVDHDNGNLIYKIEDSHIDFAVELTWAARTIRVGVVMSPQAMVTVNRSSIEMKDVIVRDLDILRSNSYLNRPCLKIFQLIAFGHVGSHDPGVLKSIRHYEKGLKKYRQKRFRDAQICFQHAVSVPSVLGPDGPSLVMHHRCTEFVRKPPKVAWNGEFELSKHHMDKLAETTQRETRR